MSRRRHFSEWLTWPRVLVVVLDIALIVAAFIWHAQAGTAILLGSLVLAAWRVRGDQVEARWHRQGGYEILESCVWLKFADRCALRTEARKKQVHRNK